MNPKDMKVFIEYLENIKLFNLILTIDDQHLLKNIKINEKQLCFSLENKQTLDSNDNNEADNQIAFYFNDFQIEENTFIHVKSIYDANPAYVENIFKFKVKDSFTTSHFKSDETIPALTHTEQKNNEIKNLMCNSCKHNILNSYAEKFCLLPLPENEADELADNYFCHLHDHGDGDRCNEESEKHENLVNLIKSLNPITDNQKLRKSILEGSTILILNKTHLNSALIKMNEKNLDILCRNCNYRIGYKKKAISTDFFLWKGNVIQNETDKTMTELVTSFKEGRYLLETRSKPKSYIYLYILSNSSAYKTFECERLNQISLKALIESEKSKKIIYKFVDNRKDFLNVAKQFDFLKSIHNDFNVTVLTISEEGFDSVTKWLKFSTEKLCFSLRNASDEFFLALV